ncbi:hypothetical protein GCM10022397_12020 [Flavivirga jejuensis]
MVDEGANTNESSLKLSNNQIVVRLKSNITTARLNHLKDTLHVLDTEVKYCSCGDQSLQLWTIDTRLIKIEEAVSSLKRESESEDDVEGGDRQFTFGLMDLGNYAQENEPGGSNTWVDLSSDAKVNIAVLDTGLDYYRTASEKPYLLNTEGLDNCSDGVSTDNRVSGWNFINDSSDFLDDQGHGTYVTNIITSTLDSINVGYRILPLKVFNNEGRGSYWDIVCAMDYVRWINEKGANINIVNASFGSEMPQRISESHKILGKIIKDMANEVLFITSAGNRALNTDAPDIGHFPSGYEYDNILAIGGHRIEIEKAVLHPHSNYGRFSIDATASYANYSLILDTRDTYVKDKVELAGTSYGTAYITALAAKFHQDNGSPTPIIIKSGLLDKASPSPFLIGKIWNGKYFK